MRARRRCPGAGRGSAERVLERHLGHVDQMFDRFRRRAQIDVERILPLRPASGDHGRGFVEAAGNLEMPVIRFAAGLAERLLDRPAGWFGLPPSVPD